MTTGFEKLQERQKCLESILNRKMSNDIHNIQQILDNMTRQTTGGDRGNTAHNIAEVQKRKYITNKSKVYSSKINHKIDPELYASMLMYNSY